MQLPWNFVQSELLSGLDSKIPGHIVRFHLLIKKKTWLRAEGKEFKRRIGPTCSNNCDSVIAVDILNTSSNLLSVVVVVVVVLALLWLLLLLLQTASTPETITVNNNNNNNNNSNSFHPTCNRRYFIRGRYRWWKLHEKDHMTRPHCDWQLLRGHTNKTIASQSVNWSFINVCACYI